MNSRPRRVLAYSREMDDNTVVTVLNLSSKSVKVKPVMEGLEGEYTDAFNGLNVRLPLSDSLKLQAWDYLLLVK